MSSGVKADSNAVNGHRFPVVDRFDIRLAEAVAHNRGARWVCQVVFTAIMGVVTVRVRDQRAVDRLPWVKVKLAGAAIKPVFG